MASSEGCNEAAPPFPAAPRRAPRRAARRAAPPARAAAQFRTNQATGVDDDDDATLLR